MKVYGNSFVTGRELAKKLAILAFVTALFAFACGFFLPQIQLVVTAFNFVVMGVLVYVIATRCKCPHCGKTITFGVLNATVCPRCKRSLISGKKVKR